MQDSQTPILTNNQAAKIANQHFGVVAFAERLVGDTDQNFLLVTTSGEKLVLKVSDPSEGGDLGLENRVIVHLNERLGEGVCPRPFPTPTGALVADLDHELKGYQARVLTFLPGLVLAEYGPHDSELLFRLGRFLGRVDQELLVFGEQPRRTRLQWDLQNGVRVIERCMDGIQDKGLRALVRGHLDRFSSQGAEIYGSCRSSLIHNDANDYNLLVDRVSLDGSHSFRLIDFGDLTWTRTIGEVAIAAAYVMLSKVDPIRAACSLLVGYHRSFPLKRHEVDILFDLICLRLSSSVALAAQRNSAHQNNTYWQISQEPIQRLLRQLEGIESRWAGYCFRDACGFPISSQTVSVLDWLQRETKAGPVLDLGAEPPIVLDLSASSTEFSSQVLFDSEFLEGEIQSRLRKAGARFAIGRYNEARVFYCRENFRQNSDTGASWRTIHLGLDLFAPAGTLVRSPLPAQVHSLWNDQQPQGYGPVVILRHGAGDGREFFTLYGHLDEAVLSEWARGRQIEAGEKIGTLGARESNGGWPPHLHFQIILDLLGRESDFPGVAPASERQLWLQICPDPNLLLKISGLSEAGDPETGEWLDPRRRARIGPSLSLAYRNPLQIVRGYGSYLYDQTGRPYLDLVNNVSHVGHSHPKITDAVTSQLSVLNTNTRYLHRLLMEYAEALCSKLPPSLEVCFFVCSGSEANELALRLARAHTRRQGVMVLDGAYHGNTTALVEMSPYKFKGAGGFTPPEYVHVLTMPDTYRGLHRGTDPQAGAKYAQEVAFQLEKLSSREQTPAAFFCESMLGCGGQIVLPNGYLLEAYRAARKFGTLCVADEVQVGFGRAGKSFWAFELQDVVPDILTLGKPIGNGHPLAAVATTREIAKSFDNGMEYFNTFGGNPVSCSAGMAVLQVIEDEGLQERARLLGVYFKDRLEELRERFPLIGDVRGEGLFLGVELVLDRITLEPAPRQAAYIVERLKEEGVLMSVDGALHNVLKIKPPLVLGETDVDYAIHCLSKILGQSNLSLRTSE